MRATRIRECGPEEEAGKGCLRMIHVCLEALMLEAGCYRRDMMERRATQRQAAPPDVMSGGRVVRYEARPGWLGTDLPVSSRRDG